MTSSSRAPGKPTPEPPPWADRQRGVRVVIQQPALPQYRVPVFRELAGRPGISVTVVYASAPGLPNVKPSGFDAEHVSMWRRQIAGGHAILWHTAQWAYATRRRADILVLHWDLHYASLVPALLRAKANRVPTILWGHGYSKNEAGWRRRPREMVAELATTLMFYNNTAAAAYVRRGWPAEQVHVALNSLDQDPIKSARRHWLERPDELEQFRRSKGLQPGPVLLFVSRLEPENRVDLLLAAAARLRTSGRFPHLTVVVVGKGSEESKLHELARSLGNADHTLFPGAIYDEKTLAPWFLTAHAFCYPQNIGLSILHAFGYGLPVITSDRLESHNPEIEAIAPGENGLLYRHGDPSSFADVVAALLDHEPLRKEMGEAALRTVSDRFSLDRMVDGFFAAIEYCREVGQASRR